jgi:hypothetical protein
MQGSVLPPRCPPSAAPRADPPRIWSIPTGSGRAGHHAGGPSSAWRCRGRRPRRPPAAAAAGDLLGRAAIGEGSGKVGHHGGGPLLSNTEVEIPAAAAPPATTSSRSLGRVPAIDDGRARGRRHGAGRGQAARHWYMNKATVVLAAAPASSVGRHSSMAPSAAWESETAATRADDAAAADDEHGGYDSGQGIVAVHQDHPEDGLQPNPKAPSVPGSFNGEVAFDRRRVRPPPVAGPGGHGPVASFSAGSATGMATIRDKMGHWHHEPLTPTRLQGSVRRPADLWGSSDRSYAFIRHNVVRM